MCQVSHTYLAHSVCKAPTGAPSFSHNAKMINNTLKSMNFLLNGVQADIPLKIHQHKISFLPPLIFN